MKNAHVGLPNPIRGGVERLRAELGFELRVDAAGSAFPEDAFSADGRIDVDRLLPSLSVQRPRESENAPLVAITTHDLAKDGCGSLFGYADPGRRTCIVSTARLGRDPETIATRLENVIRHELGHLGGQLHCQRDACLMHPVLTPEALDDRPAHLCARCARRSICPTRLLQRIAAILFLVGALALMNVSFRSLQPPPHTPFTQVAGLPGSEANAHRLAFGGTPFENASLPTDADRAVAELNRLFQLLQPPPLTVIGDGDGHASIVTADNRALLHLQHPRASAEAGRLAGELNELLRHKGPRSSSCVDCHRERLDAVLAAAKSRKAGFAHPH